MGPAQVGDSRYQATLFAQFTLSGQLICTFETHYLHPTCAGPIFERPGFDNTFYFCVFNKVEKSSEFQGVLNVPDQMEPPTHKVESDFDPL